MRMTSFSGMVVLALAGCSGLATDGSDCRPDGPLAGFGATPDEWRTIDAGTLGGVSVFWRGLDLSLASNLESTSRGRCFSPVIGLDWSKSTDRPWVPGEDSSAFLAALSAFVQTHRPPYLFVGFESDFLFETSPLEYPLWLSFYDALYDLVKSASPETRVGPVFNFEHLSGAGTFAGWITPLWEALLRHDLERIDTVGLTLFPFFAVREPRDIPEEYLEPLFSRIDRPIAILETGWPQSSGDSDAWASSEVRAFEFAERMPRLIDGRDVSSAHWLYWRESDAVDHRRDGNYSSLYLLDGSGSERMPYRAWLRLFDRI